MSARHGVAWAAGATGPETVSDARVLAGAAGSFVRAAAAGSGLPRRARKSHEAHPEAFAGAGGQGGAASSCARRLAARGDPGRCATEWGA